ncbi:Primosome PriB/single-strand DNA-binding,Nucleic acid-binding, OB-fold,Single-stranded DNA-binding protein [Cinara cedri]|uniref:Primosome PriB/single-strand DNA-binding,Nucleic acid-binding, OB-fold,Single-stranded DNA-binding protein n=1 Tax=Cinara cedri TaxID=506608 RepID=A0A5E4MZG8_9HEMI|nr:Primosome PriB/single-strand DNA-binding,Nucleic acid-binding, OB-fold,Single-stranded DNA-binding protein [Cinara cedri]
MMRSKIISNVYKSTQFIKQLNRQNYTQETAPLPNKIEKTINKVTLLGRVGADPQKRGTQEHPVVVFSLATHQNFFNNDEENSQKTDWHRVVVFRPGLRDTIFNYLQKGQRVHVSGRIMYGELKDESGSSRTTTSIVADDVIFFNGNNN